MRYNYSQSSQPIVTLKTTSKGGLGVTHWFVGRSGPVGQRHIGTVRAAWNGSGNNIRVQVGTGEAGFCDSAHVVDIARQDSTHSSNIQLQLAGDLIGRAQAYSADGGAGGTMIGEVVGTAKRIFAQGLEAPTTTGGTTLLRVHGPVNELTVAQLPLGATLRTASVGESLQVTQAHSGSIRIDGDLNREIVLSGTGTSSGGISVDASIVKDTTGTGTIIVEGHLSGSITAGGGIAGDITIEGNMSGDIIADLDADGVGVISGQVTFGGIFSGDICDANLSAAVWNGQSPQLPSNINVTGPYTICAARTPVKPTALPHSATKNRMVSINPRSTNNRNVAIEIVLTSMRRCSLNPGVACETDADCASLGIGFCIEHTDVQDDLTWWVDNPWDSSCTDEDGNPLSGNPPPPCTGVWMARASTTEVVRQWTEDIVHVADCEIVPAAKYRVRAKEPLQFGYRFSDPLEFETTRRPVGKNFGDVVGPYCAQIQLPLCTAVGWRAPDGFVNMNDIMAVVQAFGLLPVAPHRTWADIAPGIGPNGKVNVADILNDVLAFAGVAYPNAAGFNPSDCPPGRPAPPILPGNPIPLTLTGSDSFLNDPAEWLYVDVFTGAVDELAAYEIALEVTGGTAGNLILTDIIVDNTRADYVFGTATSIIAKTVAEGRVGVLRDDGGIAVTATKNVATFVYQPESGASGVFTITLKGDGASLLNDGHGMQYPVTLGSDEVVGVGVDCWLQWHCNDNNACTTDACVNYECVFTNAAPGAACNDGHFCTATDTCNGSGICTGTGNPCPPTQWCNEFQDQCEDFAGGED